MKKLTRQGARNVTLAGDDFASLIQQKFAVLGLDPRIAKDFALRSDLICDAIERTAAINYPLPKTAVDEEGLSLPDDGWDAGQIADEVPGPLEHDADETHMSTFTESEHHELGEKVARTSLGKSYAQKSWRGGDYWMNPHQSIEQHMIESMGLAKTPKDQAHAAEQVRQAVEDTSITQVVADRILAAIGKTAGAKSAASTFGFNLFE